MDTDDYMYIITNEINDEGSSAYSEEHREIVSTVERFAKMSIRKERKFIAPRRTESKMLKTASDYNLLKEKKGLKQHMMREHHMGARDRTGLASILRLQRHLELVNTNQ